MFQKRHQTILWTFCNGALPKPHEILIKWLIVFEKMSNNIWRNKHWLYYCWEGQPKQLEQSIIFPSHHSLLYFRDKNIGGRGGVGAPEWLKDWGAKWSQGGQPQGPWRFIVFSWSGRMPCRENWKKNCLERIYSKEMYEIQCCYG